MRRYNPRDIKSCQSPFWELQFQYQKRLLMRQSETAYPHLEYPTYFVRRLRTELPSSGYLSTTRYAIWAFVFSCNWELLNMYCASNITEKNKSRKMWWAGNVACMGTKTSAQNILWLWPSTQQESGISLGEDKNRCWYVSYLFHMSIEFLLHVSTYDLGHHQAPSMIYNPSY
jgi:hypothetical protein